MKKIFSPTIWLLAAVLLSGSFSGCMNSESNPDLEPLIRVGDRVFTVLDFNKAFEKLHKLPDNSEHKLLQELTKFIKDRSW